MCYFQCSGRQWCCGLAVSMLLNWTAAEAQTADRQLKVSYFFLETGIAQTFIKKPSGSLS